MDHKKLESMFRKKQVSHIHVHQSWHTHASHITHMTSFMLVCTLVHIVDARATLQSFVMIEYIIQILQASLFGLVKVLTTVDLI